MVKKDLEILTETMYYVLMSVVKNEMSRKEMAEFVKKKTGGRVKIGIGTLSTIISIFEEEQLIIKTQLEGIKRTYAITDKGISLFHRHLQRLKNCIADGESEALL